MHHVSKFIFSAAMISMLSGNAFSAAYQLYEMGAPVVGTAGVGQAAWTTDASTAFYNPAGMALLPDNELMLGSQMMLPYVNFRKNNENTFTGSNGGNAGLVTPGMDIYFVYSHSPCLKFGLTVTSPYGGSLNYTDGWVGRYDVQNVMFYTIDLSPSVAFRFNDWANVGIGLIVEYMNLMQTVALPIPTEPLVDGQVNLKVANTKPGANIGLLLTPMPGMKIGIDYRSQIVHKLSGDLTFYRLDFNPNTVLRMVMPATVTLSYAQDIYCYGTLLAEIGWADYSSMRASTVTVAGFSNATELDWNNTYRFGLGAQLRISPALMVQAGGSYDSSPTKASRRLPELPFDRQIRVGTGLILDVAKNIQVAASYEYMNMGQAKIHNVSNIGTLSGHYTRNYLNTMQFSINGKF